MCDCAELAAYDGDQEPWLRRRDELAAQIGHWRRSPIDPHVVARLRTSAYQKAVVMKYIDNLIAWADQLFRQDTIESVNEATQHYLLAAEILGRRPLVLDQPGVAAAGFGAALLPRRHPRLRRCSHPWHAATATPSPSWRTACSTSRTGTRRTIRRCARRCCGCRCSRCRATTSCWAAGTWSRTGCSRSATARTSRARSASCALYEPPIEPGLLVRAAAAGADIAAVLRDEQAPLPPYRFTVMLRTALECCDDVRALGADFLLALERKDIEGLAQLRARQGAFSLQRQILDKTADELTQRVDELGAGALGFRATHRRLRAPDR